MYQLIDACARSQPGERRGMVNVLWQLSVYGPLLTIVFLLLGGGLWSGISRARAFDGHIVTTTATVTSVTRHKSYWIVRYTFVDANNVSHWADHSPMQNRMQARGERVPVHYVPGRPGFSTLDIADTKLCLQRLRMKIPAFMVALSVLFIFGPAMLPLSFAIVRRRYAPNVPLGPTANASTGR